MKLVIRECKLDDLLALCKISSITYSDTFAHQNTPSNMKAYLDKAFEIGKLRDELSNNNSNFFFLYSDGVLSAYLKLNEYNAQTDIHDPKSLEIERIYVMREFQGKGLGGVLMDKAIEVAYAREKSYIWLGVWEKNDRALKFYKKKGFYEIGKHSFFMGEEEQTDFLLRRDLASSCRDEK